MSQPYLLNLLVLILTWSCLKAPPKVSDSTFCYSVISQSFSWTDAFSRTIQYIYVASIPSPTTTLMFVPPWLTPLLLPSQAEKLTSMGGHKVKRTWIIPIIICKQQWHPLGLRCLPMNHPSTRKKKNHVTMTMKTVLLRCTYFEGHFKWPFSWLI